MHGLPNECNTTVSFSKTAMLYPWLILALYLHTLVIMFQSLGFFLFWRKKFFDFWFIEKKTTLRQKILIYITLQTFYRVLPKCILVLFIPKNEAKQLPWLTTAKIPTLLVLCMLSMFQLSLTTQARNMQCNIMALRTQKVSGPFKKRAPGQKNLHLFHCIFQ